MTVRRSFVWERVARGPAPVCPRCADPLRPVRDLDVPDVGTVREAWVCGCAVGHRRRRA